MILEGKLVLEAPIQKIWDSLLDQETLAACVPGLEKMEKIDENNFESVVGAKVGSISAKFKFKTTLTEVNPPTHLKAVGRGEELSKAGTFSQETVVDLREISEGKVEVSYRSEVTIVGRLATFGDRIMRAKAKEVQEEFTQALSKRLLGQKATVSRVEVSIWEVLVTFLITLWERIKKVFKR